MLGDSVRIKRMLDSLEQDIENFWTEKQRKCIRTGLEDGSYCRSNFTDLIISADGNVASPEYQREVKKCIYLWYNTKSGMCYVGKTDSERKARDNTHKQYFRAMKKRETNPSEKLPKASLFDHQLYHHNPEFWECITICQYTNNAEMNRLEPLHILVLNTSHSRINPMGFNSEAGGDWSASN